MGVWVTCLSRSPFVLQTRRYLHGAPSIISMLQYIYLPRLLFVVRRSIYVVQIISAQQLPRAKDKDGREILTKHIVDPFVEVSLLIPDWTHSPFQLNNLMV